MRPIGDREDGTLAVNPGACSKARITHRGGRGHNQGGRMEAAGAYLLLGGVSGRQRPTRARL